MELSSDPVAATLDMSQVKSAADDDDEEPFDGDADYESLPPHVSVTTHMTAGAVAGILEHTVMYPVDSVKVTRSEAHLSLSLSCTRKHTHTRVFFFELTSGRLPILG